MRDSALVLGAGAGALVSVATQQAAAATLPVTVLVALGLFERRRVAQRVDDLDLQVGALESDTNQKLGQLEARITAHPTPETINNLQRAAMAHSDRAVVRISQALERTQQEVERKIEAIERPDLSHLYQDMAQLQDQYTYVCSTLSNLKNQVQRLSSLPRVEATEADVSQLKTELMQLRVNLESLGSESKTAQTTLQDAIRHLDRRLRQVPSNSDPNLLKGEVRELIKAVAELVPRRDFVALGEKFNTLQTEQNSLRKHVHTLRLAEESTSLNTHQNGRHGGSTKPIKELENDLTQLSGMVERIETRLNDISVPFDITTEIRGTTATYLSSLQWQLATLEQTSQELMQRYELMSTPTEPGQLPQFTPVPSVAAGNEWLTAFPLESDSVDRWDSPINQALLKALDQAQERVVMVWPWSPSATLDDELRVRFEEVLERQCRLEIGWCHASDRRQGLLVKAIRQPWHLNTALQKQLKQALKQLLPLKQRYPNRFKFKILGTDEQFLVCDRAHAIVGLETLPAASTALPNLDVRLRTTETTVIQRLLQRFDHPELGTQDTMAYFNRAGTRYDLNDLEGAIADYSYLVQLAPEDSSALNNRGVIWVDRQQPHNALADFNQALTLDPGNWAARCNRGWVYFQQGQYEPAISDWTAAIQLQPTSPIAYFYRGQAYQKQGNLSAAIADQTVTIQHVPRMALPYCYRGALYQQQQQYPAAITDLEAAASILHAQGEHRMLAQITQALGSLKKSTVPTAIAVAAAPSERP
ncbi:MAG: tetratricopeptide repeat protein [Leptolyngbyaceae cyanobacterium]